MTRTHPLAGNPKTEPDGPSLDARVAMLRRDCDRLRTEPVVLAVASLQDFADFGLGTPDEDRERTSQLQELARATRWTHAGDALAIADRHGELVFATGAAQVGSDVKHVPALAANFAGTERTVTVVAGADVSVVRAGVLGGVPQAGTFVLVACTVSVAGKPRAVVALAARAPG